ncbi:MAG: hypothetical protein QME21_14700 [Anaerolineales bacterium]|jgi:hypothetical protein|nr:hypothetical protein [Anaerolineales bacterium]
MKNWLNRIAQRSFAAHSLAFTLMASAPLLLYLTAQRGWDGWLTLLLALFVFANLLELFIP